jgi:cytoskeletal protein CcmA (bactofilin family)
VLTVSASDGTSGVASIESNIDGHGWTAYQSPITFDLLAHAVQLRATDLAGNISAPVAADVPIDPSMLASILTQSSVKLTNQLDVTTGNLHVRGDVSCNSQVHIAGDLVATGNISLTNSCAVDGNVIAGGNVTIDSTPRVGGSVTAVGSVAFQSTARVAGSITAGTTFTSTDGKTVAYLTSNGIVGGSITSGVAVPAPTLVAAFTAASFDGSAPGQTTWRAWMNATATANAAPSWSQGLTASPGCTMAPWGSSVNGSTVTVGSPLVVDARAGTSGCSNVALQQMTVKLAANLVIYADGFQSINGIAFGSADGAHHSVTIIVTGSNASSGAVSLSAASTTDSLTSLSVHTPGTVTLQGTSSLALRVESGAFVSSGAVTVR